MKHVALVCFTHFLSSSLIFFIHSIIYYDLVELCDWEDSFSGNPFVTSLILQLEHCSTVRALRTK